MVDTLKFIIKALVVGVVMVALYFLFSPYQNCMSAYSGSDVPYRGIVRICLEQTDW
jgi:hypothetical protein